VEVEIVVGREPWVKGERQQATLALGVDLGRDVEERRQRAVGLGYAYCARILGDKQPAVGANSMSVGLVKPLANGELVKPGGSTGALCTGVTIPAKAAVSAATAMPIANIISLLVFTLLPPALANTMSGCSAP
jgi:hypothetical protein